jgi:hypothetical protein
MKQTTGQVGARNIDGELNVTLGDWCSAAQQNHSRRVHEFAAPFIRCVTPGSGYVHSSMFDSAYFIRLALDGHSKRQLAVCSRSAAVSTRGNEQAQHGRHVGGLRVLKQQCEGGMAVRCSVHVGGSFEQRRNIGE